MPVVINPESEYAKELRKWEQFPEKVNGTMYPAGNPYVYRPFPKMLYKAQTWPRTGKAACFAPPVSPYGWPNQDQYQQALLEAEHFTTSCQRTVKDEGEYGLARGQGWCESPQDALAHYEAAQKALSDAAAEAAFMAARMSEAAQREFNAAQAATHEHVADVDAPKRRPGRPRKLETQEG